MRTIVKPIILFLSIGLLFTSGINTVYAKDSFPGEESQTNYTERNINECILPEYSESEDRKSDLSECNRVSTNTLNEVCGEETAERPLPKPEKTGAEPYIPPLDPVVEVPCNADCNTEYHIDKKTDGGSYNGRSYRSTDMNSEDADVNSREYEIAYVDNDRDKNVHMNDENDENKDGDILVAYNYPEDNSYTGDTSKLVTYIIICVLAGGSVLLFLRKRRK